MSNPFISDMKFTLLTLFIAALGCLPIHAQQTYPFQDTKLSDDQRLDNLISLMTLDEKIDNLSPRVPGVERLGVILKSTGRSEH